MSMALSRKRLIVMGALLLAASLVVVVAEAPSAGATGQINLNNARCEFMVDVVAVVVQQDTDPGNVDNWTIEPSLTITGKADVVGIDLVRVRNPLYPLGPMYVEVPVPFAEHTWVTETITGSTTFEGDASPNRYWLDAPVGTRAVAAHGHHHALIQALDWDEITAASLAVQVRENDSYYSDSGTSGGFTWTPVDPCDPLGGAFASLFGAFIGDPDMIISMGDNDTWAVPVTVKKATPRGQASNETDGRLVIGLEMRSEPYWQNYPPDHHPAGMNGNSR